MSPDPLKDKAMLKPPGPIAPKSYVEAYQRQQAELEQRRATSVQSDYFAGHSGFAESLIPVWGSGREAIADFKEGDVPGGMINGVAAASDLFLVGAAGKTAAKVLMKGAELGGKTLAEHGAAGVLKAGWEQVAKDAVRVAKPARKSPPFDYRRMRELVKKYDFIPEGAQVHHWGVPQGGWGKSVPNVIKNNPLNFNPMPKQAHQLTHFNLPSQKLKRYTPVERYMAATPLWAKAGTVGVGTHAAGAVKRPVDDSR